MTVATARRSLVLNADYRPLNVFPLSIVSGREAIETVYRDRAHVVDEWEEVFRSPSCEIRVPKVIALKEYQHVSADPKFCRRSILLRDRYCCQYCGKRFPPQELTYDHVIPRALEGKTVWENILTCCVSCNALKRDSMPNFSGRRRGKEMRPLKMPRQPTSSELLRAGLEFLDPVAKEDFGSYLYWTAELKA